MDGTAHPGDSDCTERWTEQVPADALHSAGAVVIAHHHDPKNRIPGAAAWIADNWRCAWEIYQAEELMEACKNVFG